MAAIKHTSQPNRYRRIERNFSFPAINERKEVVPATYDEQGNVVTPETTVLIPATVRLLMSWREWKTAEDRELNKTTDEVWSKIEGKTYNADQIVFPPADWTPNPNSNEDASTQYLVATCYLTMLADPEFAGEWTSDEV